eukprot:604211-Hanusia_phi.AAC.1
MLKGTGEGREVSERNCVALKEDGFQEGVGGGGSRCSNRRGKQLFTLSAGHADHEDQEQGVPRNKKEPTIWLLPRENLLRINLAARTRHG